MSIKKAVITIAGKNQRNLPLQTLIDKDGVEKSLLKILIEETVSGGIEEIALIINPGDSNLYGSVIGDHINRITFIKQNQPRGYGHAIYIAKEFVGNESFLHLVGDHLYVSLGQVSCASSLIKIAEAKKCSVSAVQATRENLLPLFGTVGCHRIQNEKGLYKVDKVIEKPTPTEAEQSLIVSGLRSGYYLCFFGMHVLTPSIFEILKTKLDEGSKVTLSDALNEFARIEQYLAYEMADLRYDLGEKYGLLAAQIALGLNGKDKDEMLSLLLNIMVENQLSGNFIRK